MAKKTTKKKAKEVVEAVVPTKIEFLSIDYPTEGLNNMARKINEVIEEING